MESGYRGGTSNDRITYEGMLIMDILTKLPWYVITGAGVVFVLAVVGFLVLKDRGKPDTPVEPPIDKGTQGALKGTGKFRAYHWSEVFGITVIKITKPIGSLWIADTTMPSPGACYFIKTKEKGKEDKEADYDAYDPRKNPIIEGERPQNAFDALHCSHLVNNVYSTPATMWDKFNAILPYGAAFLLFIVILVGLDKL
jgi:hypothetical protein